MLGRKIWSVCRNIGGSAARTVLARIKAAVGEGRTEVEGNHRRRALIFKTLVLQMY